MLTHLLNVREKVLKEIPITFDEAEQLLQTPRDLIPYLSAVANEVRIHFKGHEVEMCALTNAKSGHCSEDCKFCSQSGHFKTDGPVYSLIRVEVMVDCSLGFLTPDQVRRLKDAGLYRNNHNLEACQSYFDKVCSTHTYMQRVNHVQMVQEFGIHPCSGGILGMGETPLQRLELAFALRDLNADCVPINILNPRPGTPFAHLEPLEPFEIIKTIAIFRLILPKSTIKIAGGREVNLRDLQSLALQAGANGLILGNYLTTMGRNSEQDIQMLKDLGFRTRGSRRSSPDSISCAPKCS